MSEPDRVELITHQSAVEALADEWRPLAENRGNAFVTPEWFLAWLRHYGHGWDPRVAVVRRAGGSLRGVVPLIGAVSARRTTLRSCRGDLFHPAASLDDEEAVAVVAASALIPADAGRHSVELDNVDAAARWWSALAGVPSGLAIVKGPETEIPFINLGGLTWDAYLAGRSRQLRNQLGRKLRSLRSGHEVRFRRTQSVEELSTDLGSLFGFYDAHIAAGRVSLHAAGPAVRRFHLEFASAALARGWLRFYVMEVDGTPIAALYGWLMGGRWTYLQGGFDPAWSRHSPGILLFAETIREAIAEGASEYDTLLGDEPFKFRFTDGSRKARSVVLAARSDPARISAAARARLHTVWRRLPEPSRARARALAGRIPGRR